MEAGKEELKISRASVIVFLNDMVEKRILEYESKSGKGGYHRVYYPKMTREEFRQYVTDLIMEKLKTL
jgi:predicted transcriptional regulator